MEKHVEEELRVKDDDEVIDACKCCYRCGWNFTTRAETTANFWFQDVPMLTLAVLYAAYSQQARGITDGLPSVALCSDVASSYS